MPGSPSRQPQPNIPTGRPAEPVRVLLLLDREVLAQLVLLALSHGDYLTRTVATVPEALLVTRMTRPELILLDWNMPVLNGADFATAYRQEPGAHAPIVLMTAATRPEHRAAELGAADFLTKPFLIASLVEMVARFVSAGSPPRGVESGARA